MKYIVTCALWLAVPLCADPIQSARPRTLDAAQIAVMQGNIDANAAIWTQFKAGVDAYLVTVPGTAQGDFIRNFATLYSVNPATYAAYGSRAAVLLETDLNSRYPPYDVTTIAQSTASTSLTVAATASTSNTSWTVAGSAGFSVGEYIWVDSEAIQITGISGTNWTVVRARNSTSVAAHTTSAVIHRAPVVTLASTPGFTSSGGYFLLSGGLDTWHSIINVYWAYPVTGQPLQVQILCRPFASLATVNVADCFSNLANMPASYSGQSFTGFKNGYSVGQLNDMRWHLGGYAVSYDRIRSLMSADLQRRMMHLLMYIPIRNTTNWYNGCTDTNIAGNLCGGQFRSTVAATLALHGDWALAQDYYDTALTHWKTYGITSATSAFVNGQNRGLIGQEGTEYDASSRPLYLEFMELVRTGTGEDLLALAPNFAREIVDYYMHATTPQPTGVSSTYEPFPYGDILADLKDKWAPGHRSAMSLAIASLARGNSTDQQYARWAKYWISNIKPFYNPTADVPWGHYWEFLSVPHTLTADNYLVNGVSTNFWAEGLNLFAGRSGWTPDAMAVFSLCGAAKVDHTKAEQGMIEVYRKGVWLSRPEQGYHQHYSTAFATTLAPFWDSGSPYHAFMSGSLGGVCTGSYSEDSSDTYVHFRFDMSSAFDGTGFNIADRFTHVYRDVVWIKGSDTLLVTDHAKYNTSSLPNGSFGGLIVRGESPGSISQSGARVTVTEGNQKLHINRVYPAAATVLTRNPANYNLVNVRSLPSDATRTELVLDGVENVSTKASCAASTLDTITLSGFTGVWAVLNGTWPAVNHPDNVLKASRVTICLDTSGIDEAANPVWTQLSGVTATLNGGAWVKNSASGTWAAEQALISSGVRATNDHQHYIIEAADASATPGAVIALTATNASAAQMGSIISLTSNTAIPASSMSLVISGGGTKTVFATNLKASTAYTISESSGTVTLTEGPGSTTDSKGFLVFAVTSGGGVSISMSATPASLSLSCTEGEATPPTGAFTITSTGGVAAVTGIADDAAWLSVAPTSGSALLSVTAIPNCSGLTAGTQKATITVSASNASSIDIPVVLTVAARPNVSSSRALLGFTAEEGGSNPTTQDVVFSSGSPASITVADDAAWLNCLPSSGSTPLTVTCTATTGVLAAGIYSATLTATTSLGATGGIPVTFTVTNPGAPTLTSDIDELVFTHTLDGASSLSQNFTVSSSIQTSIAATLDDPSGIFVLSATSGTTPKTFTISTNLTDLFPGVYSADAAISTPGGNPIRVTLTLIVVASGTVTSSVRSLSNTALLTYGADIDANQTCLLRIVSPNNTELSRVADSGGIGRRRFVWSVPALTPSVVGYRFDAMCGALAGSTTFDTPAIGNGSTIMTVSSRAVGAGASKMKVKWGYTPSVSEPAVTVTCVSGECRAAVMVLRDRNVYFQREFLGTTNALVAGPSAILTYPVE